MKEGNHPGLLKRDHSPVYQEGLIGFLGQYITESRKALIEKVLDQRTRHVTLVLEDIYQSQNASAAVRTCECMGVQDVHIIESRSKYSVNRKVLMGSSKWVDLIRYNSKKENNTEACFSSLKESGYLIAATDPSGGTDIHTLPLNQKVAIVMGNELNGLTPFALENADVKVNIPMFGFTESFNISVSAAVCMNSLMTRLRLSEVDWRLEQDERLEMKLNWYRKCVKRPEILEKGYIERIENYTP